MLETGIKSFGAEFQDVLLSNVDHPIAGLSAGILATVLVQSSSVSTATIVGLVGSGTLTVDAAVPMIMGANIGTTVTALLASMATDEKGLTIAPVHTLFNVGGVLVFYPVPAIRHIPIRLANGLAEKASRNPLWVIGYVVGVFVLIPLVGYLLFNSS